MPSEALRNIKTMRQVKTGHDLAKNQRVKTTNSLSRTQEEIERLQSLTDRLLEQTLSKENKRFAAMEASVDKSRGRLLKAREKLAATINRNRALTELRYELQRARWEKRDPVPLKKEPPTEDGNLPQMELNY
jgi:predicted  nucleic acid-binding Zn-ribbon protein